PFLVYPEEGKLGTLRAHLSRGNPQRQELSEAGECLVVFRGPQGYITPSWYPSKKESGKVVPTWNYATVHAWGAPRVVDDAAWLRRQLEDLTREQEGLRPQPWQMGDAPQSFIAAQMKGIVGLEIPIGRIEGKWKASQNRPAADREGVVTGLRAQGAASEALAALVAGRLRKT
ncbi:MAG: FMN-binding negative transcriptional regulator, partial [Burkholderiales bacterium]